ncbi:uncharacterized protein LOC126665086 [Mercurialis annua]|uniref:uncharacterized protein LOC126665086 n=1 Tax=Mercurialis annua TaxID=3986 RepID=UPI002160C8AF|nr:uncharacterized protein LOC126665086 [Mercurialis annua]
MAMTSHESLSLSHSNNGSQHDLEASVDDNSMQSNKFWSRYFTIFNTSKSAVSPIQQQFLHPLPIDAIDIKQEKDSTDSAVMLPQILDHISCFVHLSVFGILGVLSRYLLRKLFGPSLTGVTSDSYPLYLDLPCNMVGPFLMGWLGVVFRREIGNVSDDLGVGLTIGYLGSLSSFSGWNQKMLILIVNDHLVFAAVGYLIGFFLSAYSIKFGIGTAKCFKSLLKLSNETETETNNKSRVVSSKRQLAAMVLFLAILWCASGIMLNKGLSSGSSESQLWVACLVAAPGVWIRWALARFNGRGFGKTKSLNWLPYGTLIANLSSVCVMAALAVLKKQVQGKTCDDIITGIQLGFLGCLSSVSALIAEYNEMEESNKIWRAYAYALTTLLLSFALGILIYCIPIWTM